MPSAIRATTRTRCSIMGPPKCNFRSSLNGPIPSTIKTMHTFEYAYYTRATRKSSTAKAMMPVSNDNVAPATPELPASTTTTACVVTAANHHTSSPTFARAFLAVNTTMPETHEDGNDVFDYLKMRGDAPQLSPRSLSPISVKIMKG